MFVYNTTLKIDKKIAEEWMEWQKETFVPEVLATGFFYDHRFFELLDQDDDDEKTFVVQYFASSRNAYENFLRRHEADLKNKITERWGVPFISFYTIMQTV